MLQSENRSLFNRMDVDFGGSWYECVRVRVYFFWCFGRLHSKSFNLNAHVNKTSAFILDIFGSQHDKCVACMFYIVLPYTIAIIHTNCIHNFSTNLHPHSHSPKHDQTIYKRMNVADKKNLFFSSFGNKFLYMHRMVYTMDGKKGRKKCMLRAIKNDVSSLYNNSNSTSNNVKATTTTTIRTEKKVEIKKGDWHLKYRYSGNCICVAKKKREYIGPNSQNKCKWICYDFVCTLHAGIPVLPHRLRNE